MALNRNQTLLDYGDDVFTVEGAKRWSNIQDETPLGFEELREMVAELWSEALNCPESAQGALLLAEAVNCLAKHDSHLWYAYKAAAARIAIELGCLAGWRKDERGAPVLAMFAKGVGTVWFHDPYGEVAKHLEEFCLARWPYEWSGVSRWYQARKIIADSVFRDYMSRLTTPDFLKPECCSGFHPTRIRESLKPVLLRKRSGVSSP